MELVLEIEVSHKKYGDRFKCICEKLKLTGKSRQSKEDAYDDLINQIEIKVWSESFDLKIKTKE